MIAKVISGMTLFSQSLLSRKFERFCRLFRYANLTVSPRILLSNIMANKSKFTKDIVTTTIYLSKLTSRYEYE